MRCLTCASAGNDAAAENANAGEFIACSRCQQPLYCSATCAEVGWFGHRPFCRVQAEKDDRTQLAATMRTQKQRQENMNQLRRALGQPVVAEMKSSCYLHALHLLDTVLCTDGFFAEVENKELLLLIEDLVRLFKGILTDSEGAVETTAIALSLCRLLSILLGKHEEALTVLRTGLAKLIPHKSEEKVMACWSLLEAERMNIWTRKYPNVIVAPGETPVSSQRITSGEVVASDSVPLLAWEANGFPPALTPRQTSVHDDGLRALRNAFLQRERDGLVIDGLAVSRDDLLAILLNYPQCVRAVSTNAIVSAQTYLSAISENPPPRWLVNLCFMAMVSQRRFHSNEWGFFDLVSRVPHSCSPNCIWNSETCELRALRMIDRHEPLTIDFFWRPQFDIIRQTLLKLPVSMRQESVCANVGFVCSCDRCTGGVECSHHTCVVVDKLKRQEPQDEPELHGVDTLRAFPCPLCRDKEGWRYRRLFHGAYPRQRGMSLEEANKCALQRRLNQREPWVCHRCGERWRDSEMPAGEVKLCRQAERLVSVASRGIIDRKFFEEAKGLMHDVLHLLGRQHHSAYLLACEAFVHFYRYISRRFAQTTSLLAQRHTVSWCRKWIKCAHNIKLSKDCPHVYASFIVETSFSLSSGTLRREKLLLLCHAEAHCSTAVIRGADSAEASAVSAILHDTSITEHVNNGQFSSIFARFMDVEEQEDEVELISDWESHILGRLQAEVQSNKQPNLPTHLLNALQK
ncbi:hypothetical protein MOQ_003625 [Trypanosoma cruzi marinkellei]|uniref:MYND-type domain-containing protein n=1 Tax=Trypanosoma cruzi marinkellei TaxID=85056 RepID=K2NU83_TRYCR|nr:hypothetical protein MOQ_003625 [Trypanosoma cruzi marinkellei]